MLLIVYNNIINPLILIRILIIYLKDHEFGEDGGSAILMFVVLWHLPPCLERSRYTHTENLQVNFWRIFTINVFRFKCYLCSTFN